VPARALLALMTLTLCAAAAVAGVVLAQPDAERVEVGREGFAGAVRPPGTHVPAFRLSDQDGEVVTAADVHGRPAIFTFVYSTCEDTCPAQVQAIRGALDDLGRDVPVYGVSVDPANDTADRAKAFLLKQSMRGRMRFLLGPQERLEPLWQAFGIAPQRGELDHSAYVVLVDAAGRQRVGFPFSQLTDARLAHDVGRLLG
jgi:protein SCO1/2